MAEMTHDGPPPDGPAHGEVAAAHEKRDVNIPGVIKVGVYLIIFGAVAHILVALLFARFDRMTERAQPKLSPLFKKEQTRLPQDLDRIPSPRLQVNDVADMDAVRRYEDAILKGGGAIQGEDRFKRVPIEDALSLLATSPQARAAAGLQSRPPAKGRVKKQGGR